MSALAGAVIDERRANESDLMGQPVQSPFNTDRGIVPAPELTLPSLSIVAQLGNEVMPYPLQIELTFFR